MAHGLPSNGDRAGHLRSLDAATGKVLWKKHRRWTTKFSDPNLGIASAPLVDGELVIDWNSSSRVYAF